VGSAVLTVSDGHDGSHKENGAGRSDKRGYLHKEKISSPYSDLKSNLKRSGPESIIPDLAADCRKLKTT